PRPEPQGNWQDEGNYDTGWYSNTPYEISTAQELAGLAKLVSDGNAFEGETISVTGNIDLGNHYWTPIGMSQGDSPFLGTFDGRNCTVSNIIMMDARNSGAYGGLFGINLGTIKNVKVRDVLISVNNSGNNTHSWVGGLAGYNFTGTITNCTATGSVSTSANAYSAYAGGLVGINRGGTIVDCRDVNVIVHAAFTGAIPSGVCAGGFVGKNDGAGTITNCSAIGADISTSADIAEGIAEGFAKDTNKVRATGKFAGLVDTNSTLSGNKANGTPRVGWDRRLDSPAPSDDI
ncbi:MAG: hypothetical protein LBE65_05030, partial [Synergistaceae bacterium]|nr:hypothetical protein [Synergistaceae bacterium]